MTAFATSGWLALAAALPLAGQSFSQRGFLDVSTFVYPRTAPGDSGRVVSEALLRWEPSVRAGSNWSFYGAIDGRTDTHRQVERELRLDWQDRSLQRPAIAIRRASAAYHRGGWNFEFGKQFIRWGKADILNPTDRFAPKDFLNVANSDFLGVLAARATHERGSNTFELVVSRFTPARVPLRGQRWSGLPEEAAGFRILELEAQFPTRAQVGARWSHIGRGYEFSAMFFDGNHYLPLFGIAAFGIRPAVTVQPVHPRLRQYGGDAAVPLRWFTVKGEAAWYGSATPQADEYVLWVAQLERMWGEWAFVGGYAGEAVTVRRNPFGFAPDRGMARAFLARASYTMGPRRSIAVETAVRQKGEGSWVKGEYSHLLGQHWRWVAAFTWIRGPQQDFIGQYNRNSHALLGLRYSF
jgi:hypothetical protein